MVKDIIMVRVNSVILNVSGVITLVRIILNGKEEDQNMYLLLGQEKVAMLAEIILCGLAVNQNAKNVGHY